MSKQNKKSNIIKHFKGVMEQRWEDLEPLHDASVTSLKTVSIEIQKYLIILLSHKETHEDKEVQLLSKSFQKDLNEIVNKILALKKLHEGKKGLLKTEDELVDYLNIGQEYSLIASMTTNVLFNTAAEVESKIMELCSILKKKKENELQSTDKEITNDN